MIPETKDRKLDHLRIVSSENVQSREKTTLLECVELVHQSLPQLDKKKIDLSVRFFGHKLKYPILISGMTGGHPEAKRINENLAIAAEKTGVAMGVGSQRAMMENPRLLDSYQVRKYAPSILLIGNFGIPQLEKYGAGGVEKAAKSIGANAFAIHLNNLQETVQEEGDVNSSGYARELSKACKKTKMPIIAKETGAGISMEAAKSLVKAGVSAIDIGGAGGTSWSAVELRRKNAADESSLAFWDWGIPTAASILEVRSVSKKIPLIASGGLRTGLDAAKCIALGADLAGIAYPFFKAAEKSSGAVVSAIDEIGEGIRNAMFLAGARNIAELKKTQTVITGKLMDWTIWREIKK